MIRTLSLASLVLLTTLARAGDVTLAEIRTRLSDAATLSATLAEKAEFEPEAKGDGRIHPRISHVKDWRRSRMWSGVRMQRGEPIGGWPTLAEASALRELLADPQPVIRSIASEALASLHQPEDVPRIAARLNDPAPGAVTLVDVMKSRALMSQGEREADPIHLDLGWRTPAVKDYAAAALHLVTGHDLSAENFDAWWKRNSNARECLWYWQQWLQREMDAADRKVPRKMSEFKMPLNHSEREANQTQARNELRKEFRARAAQELRTLPPEVEAKVRLLAVHDQAGGSDQTEPYNTFFSGPLNLRIDAKRCLELMEGKNLWPDVEWEHTSHYGTLVTRLVLAPDAPFTREHLEALRALLQRWQKEFGSGGALYIGISRLLPPAAPENLDAPDTRDGVLRECVRNTKEDFQRGYAAQELICVALEPNWPFLREQFFAAVPVNYRPDTRQSILRALMREPFTPEKKARLLEVLLDPRSDAYWMAQEDAFRQSAMWGINALAARELITYQEYQSLRDGPAARDVLNKIHDHLREWMTNTTNK